MLEYLGADGSDNVAVMVDVHDMAGMDAALVSPEICPAPVPTVPDNYDQRRRDCGRGIA